jgi:DNA replication and repair protein RecF
VVVTRLRLRDFRTYASAEVELGERLTVVHGPNGAGKTNLLEALYFGCTGRSCRTTNEREVVRFDAPAARVEIQGHDRDGEHELSVGFQPGEAKRFKVDGAPAERLLDAPHRPLVSVFLPDRLELVKGPPALRRSHLDQLVAALWPARAETRRSYGQALAQRNALLARVRGGGSRAALSAWDLELARHGIALRDDRAAAVDLLRPRFAAAAGELGLAGEPELRYRPRSRAASAEELAAELAERVDADLERGFTTHGPHRDDLALLRDGRELRAYGSQGEQRLALLALLLAERAALEDERGAPPLLLLDDVMSELDAERRERLVERLRIGQSVVTTTDLAHVPGADDADVVRLRVEDGAVVSDEAGRSLAGLGRPEADRSFQVAGLDAPRR